MPVTIAKAPKVIKVRSLAEKDGERTQPIPVLVPVSATPIPPAPQPTPEPYPFPKHPSPWPVTGRLALPRGEAPEDESPATEPEAEAEGDEEGVEQDLSELHAIAAKWQSRTGYMVWYGEATREFWAMGMTGMGSFPDEMTMCQSMGWES